MAMGTKYWKFMSSLTYSTYEIHLPITKKILIVIQVQVQDLWPVSKLPGTHRGISKFIW